MFGQRLNIHRIFEQLTKPLIRLRVCPGWSEPLLVANTTLLEISYCGSNVIGISFVKVRPGLSQTFISMTNCKICFKIWNLCSNPKNLDNIISCLENSVDLDQLASQMPADQDLP